MSGVGVRFYLLVRERNTHIGSQGSRSRSTRQRSTAVVDILYPNGTMIFYKLGEVNMASKSYPIWNIVTACIYKGAKSYGVRERGEVEVRIGTSRSNSHTFLKHRTTHKILENGDREYRFYVDDKCIRRALLPKGTREIKHLAL